MTNTTTGNTLYYTHEFDDLESELVWDVWYDETSSRAYVSLQGYIYAYDNVPLDAVEDLVDSASIGRAFNGSFMRKGFKQTYGPGTNLGYETKWSKVERVAVAVSNPGDAVVASGVVGKNLTYAEDATVDGKPVRVKLRADKDKMIPLRPLDGLDERLQAEIDAKKSAYTVHFESNGSKTYTTQAVSWQTAVENLEQAAEILGVDVKVTGVFVHIG